MGKTIYEKRTWVVDKEGHTVTTNRVECGNPIPKRTAIQRGLVKVSQEEMQKLFSEEELKEMGYDTKEKDPQ